MSEPLSIARNQRAIRNLAVTLERWGLADAHQRAEHVAMNLLADGLAPVEKPPTLRGPSSTPEARAAALAHIKALIADAQRRHQEQATTSKETQP